MFNVEVADRVVRERMLDHCRVWIRDSQFLRDYVTKRLLSEDFTDNRMELIQRAASDLALRSGDASDEAKRQYIVEIVANLGANQDWNIRGLIKSPRNDTYAFGV